MTAAVISLNGGTPRWSQWLASVSSSSTTLSVSTNSSHSAYKQHQRVSTNTRPTTSTRVHKPQPLRLEHALSVYCVRADNCSVTQSTADWLSRWRVSDSFTTKARREWTRAVDIATDHLLDTATDHCYWPLVGLTTATDRLWLEDSDEQLRLVVDRQRRHVEAGVMKTRLVQPVRQRAIQPVTHTHTCTHAHTHTHTHTHHNSSLVTEIFYLFTTEILSPRVTLKRDRLEQVEAGERCCAAEHLPFNTSHL